MNLRFSMVFVTVMVLGAMLCACQKSSTEGGGETAGADVAHGEQIFMATCATCHGTDGTGVKGLGKGLIGSEFVGKATDDQLVQMIMKGRDAKDPLNTTGVAMPPNGGNAALGEKDLHDVVAYVRKLTK